MKPPGVKRGDPKPARMRGSTTWLSMRKNSTSTERSSGTAGLRSMTPDEAAHALERLAALGGQGGPERGAGGHLWPHLERHVDSGAAPALRHPRPIPRPHPPLPAPEPPA